MSMEIIGVPTYRDHIRPPAPGGVVPEPGLEPEPAPEPGPAPEPAPEPEPGPEPGPIVRKNQADMTDTEKTRFRNGVQALIANTFFSTHVGHHAIMTHRMHGTTSGFIGFERFLSWHRVYLSRLGEALRTIDERNFVPYWQWTVDQQVPDWLADFMPAGITRPDGTPIAITRDPGGDPFAANLPDQASIDAIMDVDDWFNFTRRLEGVPFGAHNQVHVWVGGTMLQVPIAPADPLFWLHHGEIDRLWHLWQQDNPGEDPNLSGPDAVMDPWPETVDDVLDIADLNYTYG